MTILSAYHRLKCLTTEGILTVTKVGCLQDEFKGRWCMPWDVVGGHVSVSLCTNPGGILRHICGEQRVPDIIQPYQ